MAGVAGGGGGVAARDHRVRFFVAAGWQTRGLEIAARASAAHQPASTVFVTGLGSHMPDPVDVDNVTRWDLQPGVDRTDVNAALLFGADDLPSQGGVARITVLGKDLDEVTDLERTLRSNRYVSIIASQSSRILRSGRNR